MKRRKLRYRVAGYFGYDLVKRRRNIHVYLERHVARVLGAQRVNCVIDAGANVGQYGELIRRAGYAGRIASFEPVPSAFEPLAGKASSDPDWACYPVALGNRDDIRPMNVLSSSVLSSFLPTNRFAAERLAGEVPVERIENVRVRRLDSILHEVIAGLAEPRIFLKMDTQGYDLEVFSGASGCLDRVVGLQSELALIPIYEGMPTFLQALDTYLRHGFRVTGFYPVVRDARELALVEVDCVMVRSDSPPKPGPA